MRTLGTATLLVTLSVVGCGGDSVTDDSVLADVTLSDTGAAIDRVYPIHSRRIARGHLEKMIRYELRSGDEVLANGVVSDPRWTRFEATNPDGSPDVEMEYLGSGQLTLRLPKQTGELVFFAANDSETDLVEVARTVFDPSRHSEPEINRSIRRAKAADDDDPQQAKFCSGGDCVELIAGNGSFVLNIDVVFVPAGFGGANDAAFREAARRVSAEMIASEDLGKYASRLNFWAYDGTGESGEIPDKRDDEDAGGDFYRKDNGYPKWNDSFRNRMQDAVDFANPELVVVIASSGSCSVNADCPHPPDDPDTDACQANGVCYNWGGVANSGKGFTVGNEGDPNLSDMLIHEIGHAYFELGDEYGVDGGENCGNKSAVNTAKRYKNLTLNPHEINGVGGSIFEVFGGATGAKDVYWDDMYTIDEPEPDFDEHPGYGYDFSALQDEVSKFVGGGTCRRKIMRGQLQCRMNWHGGYTWCPVCERLVKEKFDDWQGDADVCPSRWRDDGMCDRCLGDDPDCCGSFELLCIVRRSTCGDSVCEPLLGETTGTCLEDCSPRECGDGVCEGTEDAESCGQDCGCGAVDVSTDVAPLGCFCGADCGDYDDCCADSCSEFGTGCDS